MALNPLRLVAENVVTDGQTDGQNDRPSTVTLAAHAPRVSTVIGTLYLILILLCNLCCCNNNTCNLSTFLKTMTEVEDISLCSHSSGPSTTASGATKELKNNVAGSKVANVCFTTTMKSLET